MADAKKLTDNQVAALATFYGGVSELLKRAYAKGDALTLEDARLTLDVINVGAVITAAQFQGDLSPQEVYGAKAPSLSDPPIEDNFSDVQADVVDLQEYRAKGGLLN